MRVRWYHFYILLALFVVMVIMSSLHLHSRTIDSVGELIVATSGLDGEANWINHVRQRVLELNAPGNDLFQINSPTEYDRLERRFKVAKANLMVLFESSDQGGIEINAIRSEINDMVTAADDLFEDFRPMTRSTLTDSQHQAILIAAGPRMARMDKKQHRALWLLGGIISKNSDDRNHLVHRLEARLQARAKYQRYFFASVILILVGILAFGRRLQQSEQALIEERQRVQEERRERLTAIGELCSSVAHGMRNPLTAICSSVELTLEQAPLDNKTSQRLKATLREGERLSNRINGLLDVARMNLDIREPVNVSKVAEHAASALRPAASRQGIAFELDLPDEEIMIAGDRGKLELAVIELISNAMEQSHAGDTIRLSCGRNPETNRIVLAVEDQGPGVAEEMRDRVFDLFFSTKSHGTGIGLASVKRISRLHGGAIELTTGTDGGARFAILLPSNAQGENGRQGHSDA
ncbi:MAG: PAS domain-containing sensor histidine kinase [Phycisphaerae bacterium]